MGGGLADLSSGYDHAPGGGGGGRGEGADRYFKWIRGLAPR